MKLQWQQAPVKTQWGDGTVVASIAIDKDHTASLYCERDQTPKVDAMFAQQEPVALDVTLDGEEAQALYDQLGNDREDLSPVRLIVGKGHSGYGLYVAQAEYQDEGVVFIASVISPQPAQQEPAAVVSGYYGGQCVILPIDPARIFNSNTALYTKDQL